MPNSSPSSVAPDFSAYTSFFRTLALPQLLDRSLQNLYEAHPVSARTALETFLRVTEASEEWYFSAVVDQFDATVRQVEAQGFSSDGPGSAPCTLHFAVPLRDGGVFELFPTGSRVEVTPNNYDRFTSMLRLYRKMLPAGVAAVGQSYIDRAVPLLPVSPAENLLSSRYGVVLVFMQSHLLNRASQWYVGDRATWDRLGITYAVPFNSRLFPVEPGVTAGTAVPWQAASAYVSMALQKVRQLERLSRIGASLSADVTAISEDETRVGTTAVCQADPSETEEERSFWEELRILKAQPDKVTPDRISFLLQLPYGQVLLKENGQFLALTSQNVPEFVRLVEMKRGEIHRAFEPSDTAVRSSMTPPSSGAATASAAKPVVGSITPPTSTSVAANGSQTPTTSTPYLNRCQHSEMDSATRRRNPPEKSQTWNPTVSLVVGDLDSRFFGVLWRLHSSYLDGRVTEADLHAAGLTFSVLCQNGTYDLVPTGRNIAVTMRNIDDFFMRFIYECKRLSRQEKGSPLHPSSTHLTPAPPGTGAIVAGAYLDESDLNFLHEFERNTVALSEHVMDEETFNTLNLRWGILVPEKTFFIPLKPNGARDPVRFTEVDAYVAAVRRKIHEVRATVSQYGHYKESDHVSAAQAGGPYPRYHEKLAIEESMRMRETAVPQAVTADEKALFSPMHDTAGLFAPAQRLNL